MRRIAVLWWVVELAACGSPAPQIDAGVGDAAIDADANLCPRDPNNLTPVQRGLYSCGCCSEGQQSCVVVTADTTGLVLDVQPASMNPPPDIECVRGYVVGTCAPETAREPTTVCAFGI